MGFGFYKQKTFNESAKMSKNPFFLTPEFYKNLFAASAILQKPNATASSSDYGNSRIIDAQNFARNLFFSCNDEKEVKGNKTESHYFYEYLKN